jgi:CRISPR-associated endoribonuclease Cas6
MPYSLTISLETDTSEQLPDNCRRALHANFYDWLKRGDSDLADELHRTSGVKPFTISPLWTAGRSKRFRITLLQDSLCAPVERGFSQVSSVDIVGHELSIAEVEPQHRSYEQLWSEAGKARRMRLRFLSPTSFHSGDIHYPLPAPWQVFQSYLSKWNQFAPRKLQFNINTLDVVDTHVGLSYYSLHTEVVDFDRYKEIGFVGRAQYTVIKAHMLGPDILKRLNALADYAYFCGTGRKTTQGMGQTKAA